ncbi:MAG: low molecular weight protein-tyrosine-phosphatase [Bacteroidota bacterium]
MTQIQVLFVCLGNICRSPLAEAVFQHKVSQSGLNKKIMVDSCGTGAYHIGEDPDPRSEDVARAHGVPINHKARQLNKADIQTFHYILGMDDQNIRNIRRLVSESSDHIYKMRDFDDQGRGGDVPDPYYGGAEGFELVYQMLDRSCDRLLKKIILDNGLEQ